MSISPPVIICMIFIFSSNLSYLRYIAIYLTLSFRGLHDLFLIVLVNQNHFKNINILMFPGKESEILIMKCSASLISVIIV